MKAQLLFSFFPWVFLVWTYDQRLTGCLKPLGRCTTRHHRTRIASGLEPKIIIETAALCGSFCRCINFLSDHVFLALLIVKVYAQPHFRKLEYAFQDVVPKVFVCHGFA